MNRSNRINRIDRGTEMLLLVVVVILISNTSAFHASLSGRTNIVTSLSSTNQIPYGTPYITPESPIKRSRRRIKPQTAPLVDSTLLRFLSAQRTQISIEQMNPPPSPSTPPPSSPLSPSFLDAEIVSVVRRAQEAAADSLAWFTDYNSHNIASRLTDMGVELEEATEAGNAVQGYVMAKTARRRIRKFLRDRDSVWISDVANDGGEYEEISGIKRSATYRLSSFYEEMPVWGQNCSIDMVMQVMCEKGLTGRDIAAVFTHTPSISMSRARGASTGGDNKGNHGEMLEDTIDRAYTDILCGSLKLRKYDARKVIRTCPDLLTKRGSSSAEEVVNILSSLHVSPASLARDKASLPTLLTRSPAALFRLIAFLSGDAVRMSVDKIGPFIRRSECSILLDRVAPIPRLVSNRFGKMGQGKVAGDAPNDGMLELLLNSGDEGVEGRIIETYKTMYNTAVFLRDEVGIDDVGKVMSTYPDILMTDVEKRIIPFFDFLCDDLGIDEDDVPKIIESYPALLLIELEDMKRVALYLKSLDVSVEMFPSIFRSFPSLLTLDIRTDMMPVVEFLKSIGVTNIGRFITRLPPVLGYSVENELRPKWEFLKQVCQYASFEVRRFPAYFSYPLDRVIMSRYAYLHEIKGVPVRLLPVDEIMRFGDADFAKNVAKDINGASYIVFQAKKLNKTKRIGNQKTNQSVSKRRQVGCAVKGDTRSRMTP